LGQNLAAFEQHVADSKKWLGEGYEPVHRWLDEFFKTLGPHHRNVRHHKEGVEQIRMMFGDMAASAATIHILRDCRHIPKASHYTIGFVDALGLRKSWPTSAYVKFSEEDFDALVRMNLMGSTGLALWSFINEENIGNFLTGVAKLSPEEIKGYRNRWAEAYEKRISLPKLEMSELKLQALPESANSYIQSFLPNPIFQSIKAQYPTFEFGLAPANQLICPLVFIDNEYLEDLRAELQGKEPLDLVRFAFPNNVSASVKVVSADPSLHSATLISPQKTLTVGPLQLNQTPGGLEAKFLIASTLSMITVSEINNRLILRNGIHRAFLLAQLGFTQIPCLFTRDSQLPLVLSVAYPAFHPSVLVQPRPPLLLDFLESSLAVEIPIHQMRKVIKVSAEENLIPLD
jgi:hypothetical protein